MNFTRIDGILPFQTPKRKAANSNDQKTPVKSRKTDLMPLAKRYLGTTSTTATPVTSRRSDTLGAKTSQSTPTRTSRNDKERVVRIQGLIMAACCQINENVEKVHDITKLKRINGELRAIQDEMEALL